MIPMLHIRDWDNLFENSRTRPFARLHWVPIPNKHDGDGYTQLVEHEHGASHYGVWCLIVQVASKCSPRGLLVRDGNQPHDADSLARITRVGAHLFREAIPRLIEIGWLETVDDSAAIARCQRPDDKNRTEQNRTERKGASAAADDTDLGDGQLRGWLRWWNALHTEGLVLAGVNEENPSEAVRMAWKRCQRSREIRELLTQRKALEDRIRKSTFCREGWFRLEKLFGAKNRDRELIVRKLLEHGYEDSREKPANETKEDPLPDLTNYASVKK